MAVSQPTGDPNAQLYEQLKRDVLERIPQVSDVTYVSDDVEANHLRATFDPDGVTPTTGPESPELTVTWHRQEPQDWFQIDYRDPNTGFHAGWHQDDAHPELGPTYFEYSMPEEEDCWEISFEHETPSLILWEILKEA